jgi:hypothetical protein
LIRKESNLQCACGGVPFQIGFRSLPIEDVKEIQARKAPVAAQQGSPKDDGRKRSGISSLACALSFSFSFIEPPLLSLLRRQALSGSHERHDREKKEKEVREAQEKKDREAKEAEKREREKKRAAGGTSGGDIRNFLRMIGKHAP